MGDGILPFGRGVGSSTLSKETPVLLSHYGIADLLDGILEVLGGHRTLVVGDLDRALLDVGVGPPHSGELVQLALDRGLAVAAAHVRNPQSFSVINSPFFWTTLPKPSGSARLRR